MKTQTEKILNVLRVISQIIYIGSIVIFGLTIATVVLSYVAPDSHINFKGIINNQAELRKEHLMEYLFLFSFTIVLTFLYVRLWNSVKDILYKINLKNPFSIEIAEMLEKMGYLLLSIWIVDFISSSYADYLSKHIAGIEKGMTISFFYLFNAGIVYIISQIFKRGVEIQEENELTV